MVGRTRTYGGFERRLHPLGRAGMADSAHSWQIPTESRHLEDVQSARSPSISEQTGKVTRAHGCLGALGPCYIAGWPPIAKGRRTIDAVPSSLANLLEAPDGATVERHWETFVQRHSKLLLHVSRTTARGYDDAMDRYVFLLDQLRADDFKRLRGYANDGRTMFSTWLVLVARRLCVDYHRHKYGRPRTSEEEQRHDVTQVARRALVDLVAADLEVALVDDPQARSPDERLLETELRSALARELESLAPRDRLVLALRFENSATAREIADVVGFPSPFHVYRHLKKVLGGLRKRLEDRGLG